MRVPTPIFPLVLAPTPSLPLVAACAPSRPLEVTSRPHAAPTPASHACAAPRARHLASSVACAVASLGAGSCAAVSAPAPAPYQHFARFDTTLSVDVGRRCVDTTFGPADKQLALGIEADIRQPNDDVGLELGLFCTSDDASENVAGVGRVDFKASMTELSVGARWRYGEVWRHVRPYAAAGAAFLSSSYSADPALGASKSDSDWTIGPYVRAGVEYSFDEHWSLALDYRQVLFTDVLKSLSLGGTTTDANYSQLGLVVSYAF